jgi:cyclopropane fatty-acyl-phospholipid synthase-like methyltransferase
MSDSITNKTKGERQYQDPIREVKERGRESLGLMTSWAWRDDPKRLAFTFSRYKFVAKMLAGRKHVLEVGCGDCFATRIVAQEVAQVTAVDFDQDFIADAQARLAPDSRITAKFHDMVDGPVAGSFDGMYSLDVLEHIDASVENRFVANMIRPLQPHGVAIIGMPSLESQGYASPQSKIGHINCKSQRDFKTLMQRYFHTVFMFSMNDEVVHTGYAAMSHYNLAVCCEKISAS